MKKVNVRLQRIPLPANFILLPGGMTVHAYAQRLGQNDALGNKSR